MLCLIGIADWRCGYPAAQSWRRQPVSGHQDVPRESFQAFAKGPVPAARSKYLWPRKSSDPKLAKYEATAGFIRPAACRLDYRRFTAANVLALHVISASIISPAMAAV